MEKIYAIELNTIREFVSIEGVADKFLVFDNYTGSRKGLNILAVTDHPMKLDSIMAIGCSEGYLRIAVGFEEFTVSENHFLLVMNGKPFQVLEINDDCKVEVVCLKQEFFELQGSQIMNVLGILTDNPLQEVPASKMEEVVSIAKIITSSLSDIDNIYRFQIAQHYFYIIFYIVCDVLLRSDVGNKALARNEWLFQRFLKEVEKNFKHERKLAFYADKLNLTPKYLSTLIYKMSGKYATDWIDGYTLLEAKALLKSSSMSIQQISYDLNFSNPSHFGRYFRHHTGMSPKEYRRS